MLVESVPVAVRVGSVGRTRIPGMEAEAKPKPEWKEHMFARGHKKVSGTNSDYLISRKNKALPAFSAGKALLSRENRSPIELFLADVASWEPHIIRLVQAA